MTTPEESGPPPGPHAAYLTATAAANEMLQTADKRTAAAVHAQLATAHARGAGRRRTRRRSSAPATFTAMRAANAGAYPP